MTPPVTRATAGGRAYLALQAQARRDKRPTSELFVLYILESFLRRLAGSEHRECLVLKGGVLLAALGDRRATRDLDFQGQQISNDEADVARLICGIAALPADDGVVFDTDTATTEVIREEGGYTGIRVRMAAQLDRAREAFAVDLSVGDPIEPGPQTISMPTLLGAAPLSLLGYPLEMVLAEKTVTALERGTVNTRWRDFADMWILSRRQQCSGDDFQAALHAVAEHRGAELEPLLPALDGMPDLVQRKWSTWRACPCPSRSASPSCSRTWLPSRPRRSPEPPVAAGGARANWRGNASRSSPARSGAMADMPVIRLAYPSTTAASKRESRPRERQLAVVESAPPQQDRSARDDEGQQARETCAAGASARESRCFNGE